MRFNVSHLDMLLDERSLPVLHHIFLQKICKWLTQLLLAVDYLHSNRVLHGDLKVLILPCPGEKNFYIAFSLMQICLISVFQHIPFQRQRHSTWYVCVVPFKFIPSGLFIYCGFLKECMYCVYGTGDFGLAKLLNRDHLASSVLYIF